MIGQTVSDHMIQEELGSCGVGDVYRAEDTKLARCAICCYSVCQVGLAGYPIKRAGRLC